MSISISISIYLYIYISIYLYIYISIYLYIYISISISIYPSLSLSRSIYLYDAVCMHGCILKCPSAPGHGAGLKGRRVLMQPRHGLTKNGHSRVNRNDQLRLLSWLFLVWSRSRPLAGLAEAKREIRTSRRWFRT